MDENNNRKVFMIGIDAATFDLIDKYREHLPNIDYLLKNGANGSLYSMLPITAAAWTSAATGKNPGKHGVFEFTKPKKGSYFDFQPIIRTDRKSDTIWNFLSNANKKVICVNYPMTYPPEKVNGLMISDILTTPSLDSEFTSPPELKEELLREIKDFRINLNEVFRFGREDSYLREIANIHESQEKTTLYLLEKYSWDFFFTEIHAIDLMCHFFWRFTDKDYPYIDKEKNLKYKDEIFKAYKKVDETVGKYIKAVGDKATIVIMSDHGAGPLHKYVYLNNFLLYKNFLRLKKTTLVHLKYFLFRKGFTLDNVQTLIPKNLVYKLLMTKKSGKQKNKLSLLKRLTKFSPFLSPDDIDWANTVAYSVGFLSPVKINLKGREPQGSVDLKDYDKKIEEITKELLKFKDPETNELLVDKVYKKNDVLKGPFLEDAPDMMVYMKGLSYIGRENIAYIPFLSLRTNRLMEPAIENVNISGTHRTNGVVILKGENINNMSIKNANIEDIAPTVLYLMGLQIPSDTDGKVLDVFEQSHIASHPIKYTDYKENENVSDNEYSQTDETKIKDRLRSLGYIS